MKNILTLIICAFGFTCLMAQKSSISANVGYSEHSLFLQSRGLAVGLTYDYALTKRFTISTSVGMTNSKDDSNLYVSNGANPSSYELIERERNIQEDLSVLYSILDDAKKFNVKVGAGVSFAQSAVVYPSYLSFKNGDIFEQKETTYKSNSTLANIVLEPSVRLNSKFSIGLRGTYRIGRNQNENPLIREYIYTYDVNGMPDVTTYTITGAIKNIYNYEAALKISYTF